MTVLGIVGSVKITPTDPRAPYAAALILEALEKFNPTQVVSGGAVGIDTLGADVARAYGFDVHEFLPEFPRWAPRGYKARNELIAQCSTHLLRIAAKESRTYGSGWTADHAEKVWGAQVARVTL